MFRCWPEKTDATGLLNLYLRFVHLVEIPCEAFPGLCVVMSATSMGNHPQKYAGCIIARAGMIQEILARRQQSIRFIHFRP